MPTALQSGRYANWKGVDMTDEIKSGMRNNADDRRRIREVRGHARAIHDLSRELEPTDDDEAMDKQHFADMVQGHKSDGVLIALGPAVKALGDGRIGGYLVQFGAPDQPDLTGEFFSAETDYGEATVSDVYYNHGKDARLGLRRLGRADLRKDDVGVWAETQLALRDEYERRIYGMAEAGKLGWSSGTANHLVEREPQGKAVRILRWPLGLDASLTPMPAEPRNRIVALKTWEPEASLVSDGQPADGENIKSVTITPVMGFVRETTTMDANTATKSVDERIDDLSKAVNQILQFVQDSPAIKNVGYVSQDGGKADRNVKSFGDFLTAIARRDVTRLHSVYGSTKANDLTSATGELGGYLVPSDYNNSLLQVAFQRSPILSLIDRIPVSTQSGEWPALDQFVAPTAGVGKSAFAGGLSVAARAEGGTYTETNPTFEMLQWRVASIGGYTQVSNELMADNAVSIEALLRSLIGVAIAAKEEYYVLRGNGAGEPLGVLNAPCTIGVTTAADNVFSITDATNMLSRFLPVGGRPVWVMHRGVLPDLAAAGIASTVTTLMTDLQGQNPMNLSLYGYPIVFSEHMPQANYDDVLLADFSAYKLWVRGGLEIDFSPHYAFINGQGTWRFGERLDGKPWLKSAITLADPQGSYTLSPFCYHDD